MATSIVSICILIAFIIPLTLATRTCHQCSGINCQRINYFNMEICANELDVCATIFKGPMVEAQGCFEQISEDLRAKCTQEKGDERNCHICNEDACNKLGAIDFKCIQCDSKTNGMCHKNPEALEALRCPMARTLNSYCYTYFDEKDDRIERGCALTAKDIKDCSNIENCIICSPFDLMACNSVPLNGGSNNTDSNDHGNESRASHTNIALTLIVMQLLLLIFNTNSKF